MKITIDGFNYEIKGRVIGLITETKSDYILSIKPFFAPISPLIKRGKTLQTKK